MNAYWSQGYGALPVFKIGLDQESKYLLKHSTNSTQQAFGICPGHPNNAPDICSKARITVTDSITGQFVSREQTKLILTVFELLNLRHITKLLTAYLMGAADEKIRKAQAMNYIGCCWEQGDNPEALNS